MSIALNIITKPIVDQKMSKIAIIGASYLQLPLVRKAKEMGLEIHCFAWDKDAVCKEEVDSFYPISIVEKEKIFQICQSIEIDGICTIASDVAAPTVSYVAEKMHLNANSYQSAVNANNKYIMRDLLSQAEIRCPKYKMIQSLQDASSEEWEYPLIVKPTDRSGSLGVAKVMSYEELCPAVEFALSVSFEKQVMIEEFIEGREISVEFISYKGVHYPLQITDKVTTGAPHFVELEHHQPSTLSPVQYSEIYDITRRALNSLGLTDGASHSEYKIADDGKVYVMEIGGRMGGDFIGSDLVKLSTGYDFVKGVIDVALQKFEKPILTFSKYSGVYFLSKETEQLYNHFQNAARNKYIVKSEITSSKLSSLKCSGDRSGYMIYQSDYKYKIELNESNS
ncbi:acetyl-CoA carboxylase biotin carboxylase subunit family protein [Bacteroides acidifaciens]|uniref:ATP-grasp domain-containing protein n=2 Tax=Bacteroidia TaxID=200643 RepID=UPI00272D15F5|nr:ATP-grasp domain-containing protein [Bacteroides acidifaciens]